MKAIRGATTISCDTPEEIKLAVRELLNEIKDKNNLNEEILENEEVPAEESADENKKHDKKDKKVLKAMEKQLAEALKAADDAQKEKDAVNDTYLRMMAEYDKLQASKVVNSSLYLAVQDKWMEQIDATYKKIFNEQQWTAYLKSGALRAQKARAKRTAAAEKK